MAAPIPAEAPDAEPHEVTGWTCTRVDRPECGEATYAEGDARRQTVKCDNPDCGAAMSVASVV